MTPRVEVAVVWTVPGAVSPGCILAEPRKGDKLTQGGNELGGFGADISMGTTDGCHRGDPAASNRD